MGDDHKPPSTNQRSIDSFITEITSSWREVARLFLEAHQWDVDAAVSDFNSSVAFAASTSAIASTTAASAVAVASAARRNVTNPRGPTQSSNLEAIQQAERDFDEQQQARLNAAKESDDEKALPSSSSSSPRRLNEILSVTPQVITRIVTIWRNGLTHDENSLWSFDDPQSLEFLQRLERSESPREFDSPSGKRRFVVKLIRRQEEDFPESPKPFRPFQGVARTLASDEPPASSSTQPTQSVDPTAPTTSIQLILADGARIVSRFNTQQTIRDVRDFIDTAARPDGSRDYQLLNMMDFPPEPLADLDQTIEQAGISNSVLTQKF